MSNSRKKAWVIGNNADAPYHPLNAVEEELGRILQEDFQLTTSLDYGMLAAGKLEEYDLCISYTDRWEDAVSAEQAAGLLTCVANGGGLLVVHNGISLQVRPELAQLIGAKFTEHPPYTELEFQVVSGTGHPVVDGIEPFVLAEEPYRFEFDPFCAKVVLLTYRHEGQDWPAAWAHSYGLGKVVFLMPGHHLPSFQHPEVAKLLRGGAEWAAR
ncbi:MAG: ThuA domain-containing protein [Paenibacillus sp.]|uniref:ThuA domain-containing protein n=1 Tax=Paenibacillus sp. TaxID=58172 RepID=UPI002900ABEF|nr:ThuA domain-containing protein [Paenibacillus sp.]MDU2243221.1 ThuA domain-containing protein [Paenibacillus sp.]